MRAVVYVQYVASEIRNMEIPKAHHHEQVHTARAFSD